ncbi:hypothetical protein HDV06_005724 [Boothiomyces sp. JEL0866]|nr:hypothetical protein HDV06_005724 [Boothiomyces sp. JEL0866]
MQDQVKKPLNAYFYYRMAKRSEIIKQHPNINSMQVAKIAAKLWKSEPNSVKQVYRQMSKKAFEEHKINYPNFIWQTGKKKRDEPDYYIANLQCHYEAFDDLVKSFLEEFPLGVKLE